MAKLFKLKHIIVFMLMLCLVTSAAAFSVSYAKWTGSNDTVSASLSTGSWETGSGDYENGLTYTVNDKEYKVDIEDKIIVDDYGFSTVYIEINPNITETIIDFTLKIGDITTQLSLDTTAADSVYKGDKWGGRWLSILNYTIKADGTGFYNLFFDGVIESAVFQVNDAIEKGKLLRIGF